MEVSSEKEHAHKPISIALLKVQLTRLIDQHNNRGVIYTKDLLSLIDKYELSKDVVLLTKQQKRAILPYTLKDPDLEMTPDDILNLLKIVCPPLPISSLSEPTTATYQRKFEETIKTIDSRPRTSIPLKSNKSTPWKRRLSAIVTTIHEEEEHILSPLNNSIEDHSQTKEEQYSSQDLAQYYRRSLKLTQRLKCSERSLASIARDNEDRIIELQNKVDDMNLEVVKQRKEILEYKGKERNSLEQISALESHIANIQRSETDKKQVYLSIKTLFDEKCQEAQKLQDSLKQKEVCLEKSEDLLNNLQNEVQLLKNERHRLVDLQNTLELELETSAKAHKELAEQKSENEKLKEIIDSLKTDLNVALLHQHDTSHDVSFEEQKTLKRQLSLESHASFKTLDNELLLDKDENEASVEYYKHRADETNKDLDRVKNEFNYLQKALKSENDSLINELNELKTKANTTTTADITNHIPEDLLNTIISKPNTLDIWTPSRVRPVGNQKDKRKRTVQDLHQSIRLHTTTSKDISTIKDRNHKGLTRKEDRIVTNTVTFALYTLLVYFFGIITSTFLLDGNTTSWEQALAAAAASSGQVPKSKFLEIILYWIEKLLFEPEGLPLS
ncbi:uncharacterized protein BX663DRAFT_516112 [Cokeromyces recurvatus]|uniref:uncharacterized protein n=1 Tax=Cokeromyces recurvatus TaxID=90255 RepID=UPI00221E57A9|nr:uncharacterized protein BX663DRAFT_516112 [Cokeromyces recurvatus]KAI7901039.1 hypothetical protein BX663DRAFT_516112 [Cokeromyces recurvatus]